ncbi:uncharacterized protein LOC135481418 [Liolophura sinensis]|uniref:uncharacterized protein LOC135481418 n=1 Tax=Liolophura sinensis TaxID=3198878 RepID=UPI0031589671
MESSTSSSSSSTPPLRFYPALDIVLLKEVLAVDPYRLDRNTEEWEKISTNVNSSLTGTKKVSVRGCKDGMKTLLKAHRRAEMMSLKASGTDEEYTERDVLLTDVDEMEREAAKCKEEKKGAQSAEKQKEEQGKEIREAAMQSLKRSGENAGQDDAASPKKRRSGRTDFTTYFEMLREKNNKDAELKAKQLELEKEKFDLERREREFRMERDSLMMDLIRQLIDKKNNES